MYEHDQKFSLRFADMGRMLLYVFAAAVPLWFVPWQINIDFGREVTFLLLILGALVAWLLSGLVTGTFRFMRSSALYAGAAFLIAASVSTLVSKNPFAAAFLRDPSAEKLSTLLAGFLVMIAAANLLSSRKDVMRALIIFILAAGAEAAMTFFSLAFHWSLFRIVAPFVQGDDFNVIGTINGAVLLYATGLMMALGFIFAPTFHGLRAWVRWALYVSIVFFAANLLMVHFRTAWILLFATSLIFSGFMFWMSSSPKATEDEQTGESLPLGALAKRGKYAASLIVLACSMVMIMVSSPLVGRVSLPT